ncbi:hypothetical protein [Rasiella sp. SM2506]|uniref:hypothetical protein n=1 Tax=Rasiella sp. SM2506 TaxID=3423914 RepID=UPI003D78EBC3
MKQEQVDFYKTRLNELRGSSDVIEYLALNNLIGELQSYVYNAELNKVEINSKVNEPNLFEPEYKEKKNDERDSVDLSDNIVVGLLSHLEKAANRQQLMDDYKAKTGIDKELKYIIRHQYKIGNLVLVKINNSRKYSYYALPEWVENGSLSKSYLPNKKYTPSNIHSVSVQYKDDE